MRFAALPPVRRAVPLRRGDAGARLAMERFFGNRRITLHASGTAALARAISGCAAGRSVSAPEVIIPAYGCPDLVAACLHASVHPRLVDIASSKWSYDPEDLKSALSPHTVAIVAVNLCGIGDGAAELLPTCQQNGIALIQDSAQYLPRAPIGWCGDYVVLSFGRGKPMNLLHGGALIEPPGYSKGSPAGFAQYTRRDRLLASRAAAIAFNVLTRPHAYRLLSSLPGTGLGDVTYKPLGVAGRLPETAWNQVGTAFALYCGRPSYQREIWASAIEEWSDLEISALDCPASAPQTELLRLALLAPDRAARDFLVHSLNRRGLGASRLYGTDLPHVTGVPEIVTRQGPFPNASALADRLFTLPTHDLVTAATVKAVRNIILAWARRKHASGRS